MTGALWRRHPAKLPRAPTRAVPEDKLEMMGPSLYDPKSFETRQLLPCPYFVRDRLGRGDIEERKQLRARNGASLPATELPARNCRVGIQFALSPKEARDY